MTMQMKFIVCLFFVALVSIFFYTNQSQAPISTAIISNREFELDIKNEEWRKFLELETYIASQLKAEQNYENFGLGLDNIFNETFVYRKALWDYAIDKLQRSFPERDLAIIVSVLRCYQTYKSQLELTSKFDSIEARYGYLFNQRIKYFGFSNSKKLFAAEISFVQEKFSLDMEGHETLLHPICPLVDIP